MGVTVAQIWERVLVGVDWGMVLLVPLALVYAGVAIQLVRGLGSPGVWGSVLVAFLGVPLVCGLLVWATADARRISVATFVPFLASAALLGLFGGGAAAGTLAWRLRRGAPLSATPRVLLETGSAFLTGVALFVGLMAALGLHLLTERW